mmetsp:Transcript_17774/g.24815  ORF Transcript_17774/g.24815 Transcript_17774/m.24815 type:complete len:107 (+) Transcript_17774:1539-1859(+)
MSGMQVAFIYLIFPKFFFLVSPPPFRLCATEVGMMALTHLPNYRRYGFGAKRKNKVRLKLSLPELVRTVAKVEVSMSSSFITLGAMVTTLDGDDVDIPAVRFWLKQ